MKTSEKIDQILPQLFAIKSKVKAFAKEADNPYFSSKYVDLNQLLEGLEPLLADHDMILLQPVNGKSIESMLLHKSGQYVSSEMEMVLNKNTMQEAGSAVSYARRYTLMSLLSLKAVDDDGNVATGLAKPAASKPAIFNKPAPKAEAPAASAPKEEPKNEAKAAAPTKKAFPFKPKAAPTTNGAVDASQFD